LYGYQSHFYEASMKKIFSLSALSMAIGVACGAFGAHGLRDVVPPSELLIWEKAVFYQLIHAISSMMVLNANKLVPEHVARRVALLFLGGTFVFSGSLYLLVLTNIRWLGAITPIGGASFIVAWVILALGTSKGTNH
jgi:uncharacterized membrane protein YgdD (TMEM256/DUF423 family)